MIENWGSIKIEKGLCQNAKKAHCRDIFLYLSAKQLLIINSLQTDKYKNMSLLWAVSAF